MPSPSSPRVERALISVSDKTGLADFASALAAASVRLYSTGGTRRFLESQGLSVVDVSDYTGFPEMMEGRVKTLHPKIHGGILCRRDVPGDMASVAEHGIEPFELVVVNLYPFEATIGRAGVTDEECVEQIDIGGPSLVRAAAKNHPFVTVACEPAQYEGILRQVAAEGATTLDLRRRLAAAAYAHTARYDAAVASWFARGEALEGFPSTWRMELSRRAVLRYGENPHQSAAVYAEPHAAGATLVTARQTNGKELSYNNLLDLDSALAMVRHAADAMCVVIKHNNPCGAAQHAALATAARMALEGDPLSAFGSIVAVNQPLDVDTALVLVEPGRFIEAIVAPSFDRQAHDILTTRPKWKANVRLLEVGPLDQGDSAWDFRRIAGGFLVQQADLARDDEAEWRAVTDRQPSAAVLDDLRFAWHMVRFVKSNAIVLAKDRTLVGVGAGQMSRVDSVEIAVKKAGERATGSVLGSDAFFPFPDSIAAAAAAGVTAVIQPGGSKNDGDVIAACNQHGLTMVLTGRRHFKH